MATADKINREPYERILSKFSPIYYAIQEKNKNFIEDNNLNFKAALPSYINKNGIIEYAENYEKNIEEIYNKVRKKCFDKYCYYLTRSNGDYLGGIYDFLYYLRIHVKAAVRFLDENNIKNIILAAPSAGFDNIVYEVSKIMGIEHFGLIQMHNNRFFWVKDWYDFGTFSSSLPVFPAHNIKIKNEIKDPYFMIRVQNKNKKKKLEIFKNYLEFLKNFIAPFYYALNFLKSLVNQNLKNISLSTSQWMYLGNKLRFFAYKFIQLENIKLRSRIEKSFFFEDDGYLKILYYLKVQPEATEAFLDCYYDDQSLVLDKLQNLSPPKTKIYIKEHPDSKRNDPMARANFWNSISKKKNIFVIPSEERTLSLIKSFDVIATIDGTIGWEAIKNLKPVICFGKPWYLSMPGVFEVNKICNLDVVFQKRWSLEDINIKFTELTKKMGVGYVCHVNEGAINAYDEFTNYEPLTSDQKKKLLKENDEVVAKSLYKILENTMHKKIKEKK